MKDEKKPKEKKKFTEAYITPADGGIRDLGKVKLIKNGDGGIQVIHADGRNFLHFKDYGLFLLEFVEIEREVD